MQQKYSILINNILAEPLAKIVKLTEDTVVIEAKYNYTFVRFTIIQSFGKVVIKLEQVSNILGNNSKTWEFLIIKIKRIL